MEDKPSNYSRLHTSPIDGRHQVEVWQHVVTRERFYLPMYSRTGRTWANYMRDGEIVFCQSYAAAVRYMRLDWHSRTGGLGNGRV